jgi:proline iminopeptidase
MRKYVLSLCLLSFFILFHAPVLSAKGSLKIEDGYKEINGTRLYYKTIGSGTPIVILHGGPGFNHTYFLPQMQELAKKYKLIFFDQRTCGRSERLVDSAHLQLLNQIEDVEGIRKAFGIDNMILMGHSFGGLLAENYAIKYPEHLKALILVNPSAHESRYTIETSENQKKRYTKEDSLERVEIMQTDDFKRKEHTAYEKLFRINLRSTFYDRNLVDSITIWLPEDFYFRNSLWKWVSIENWFYNIGTEMANILCPVLIIHGDHDPLPQKAIDDLHDRIIHSRVVTLKNCGHFPFIEAKKDFFASITKFVNELEKKKK